MDDNGRPVTVRVETPRQEAVAALLRHSDAVAARLYPNEHRRALNPDTLDAPGVSVFVARTQDGAAAGCCALFDLGGGAGELKRMIVDPAFRQRGVGRALLAAVEATALSQGMAVIRMEVGIRNTDVEALYRRAGYRERGPFGAYQASPVSRFFETVLGAADAVSPTRYGLRAGRSHRRPLIAILRAASWMAGSSPGSTRGPAMTART